jgi:hypothetical protein
MLASTCLVSAVERFLYPVLSRDGTSVAHAHCQWAQYSRRLIRVKGDTLRKMLECVRFTLECA